MNTPRQPKRLETDGSFFLEFIGTRAARAEGESEGLAVVFRILSSNRLEFLTGQEIFLLFPTKVWNKSTSEAERIVASNAKLYAWFCDEIAQGTNGEFTAEQIDMAFCEYGEDLYGGKALQDRLRIQLITTVHEQPHKIMTLKVNAVAWRKKPTVKLAPPGFNEN